MPVSTEANSQPLLDSNDPPAVEWYNRQQRGRVILICEHAGKHVPQCLHNLGLSQIELESHIGWDIGAESLAKRVSDALQAPLLLQRYSRLVIDCNRPPGSAQSIPAVSDAVTVPGNTQLGDAETTARQTQIFHPFDHAIENALNTHAYTAAFSIHSFTPQMQGFERPWQAGFLARQDLRTAEKLMNYIGNSDPRLTLALNEPYQIEDESDWFIPRYAEPRALKHTLIEVRNDQLLKEAGIAHWAGLISKAIQRLLMENDA
jgi:predicted N-formylglutamate amidohydrolase